MATHFSTCFAADKAFQPIRVRSCKTSLRREEATKGKDARQHLQFLLATTDHLDDVMAALAFLKAAPAIDAKRIAIVGHSFGGQLTLLATERDNAVRAAVTFAATAGWWGASA